MLPPLLFFFLLPPSLLAADILTPANPLTDGDTLLSSAGTFALGFFTPPGSTHRYLGIWYHTIPLRTIVWVANSRSPITTGPGGQLSLSANGTLTISQRNSTPVWYSNIDSSPTLAPSAQARAQLLDTGNFVVVSGPGSGGGFVWQSFDYPTDTLLPGMKIGWDLSSALYRNLSSWTSSSNPAPGLYMVSLDMEPDPELYLYSGSTRVWRSGPWNGMEFAGIPDMHTYYTLFTFNFLMNSTLAYYSFGLRNSTLFSKLTINESGTIQRLVWASETGTWNLFWFAPKDQCDALGACGLNGICNSNESPICYCLQGFTPRYPSNWALRDASGGCVRRTPLDCVNNTDGFVTVSGVKLPKMSSSVVNFTASFDQCQALCLAGCECIAYSAAYISDRRGATGCLMWTAELYDLRYFTHGGEDIYLRLARADLDGDPQKRRRTTVVLVIGIACGSLAAIVSFACVILSRKRGRSDTGAYALSTHYQDIIAGEEVELPMFDFDVIVSATDDFSFSNKLGEGGFGPVFKGKLVDGREIAIKRLSKISLQGSDEFKNELILIAKLQHRNLVKLLGCCVQGEERILVYEYMPNKSLDTFLFDRSNAILLDWQTRYQIVKGIARGLMYLHHDSIYRIIHRDLKAANILLDKDMNPKISDFGMARLFGGEETQVNTRRVVGTYGYMSPEYAMDGICSVKSDVYSFGVLTLEIVSGKRNRGLSFFEAEKNLLGYAWSSWKEQNIMKLIDTSIGYSLPMDEVARCVKIGLLCVQESPDDRPSMSSVILMLGSDDVPLPDPKRPGFLTTKMSLDLSISIQQMSTVNEIKVAKV